MVIPFVKTEWLLSTHTPTPSCYMTQILLKSMWNNSLSNVRDPFLYYEE